ncbi:hypothetical protein BC629DRAFT_69812 [Irpex lacteus]|nr:hypothetical protein BC629DRAFT_69812 [Irpex lacteus]
MSMLNIRTARVSRRHDRMINTYVSHKFCLGRHPWITSSIMHIDMFHDPRRSYLNAGVTSVQVFILAAAESPIGSRVDTVNTYSRHMIRLMVQCSIRVDPELRGLNLSTLPQGDYKVRASSCYFACHMPRDVARLLDSARPECQSNDDRT